MLCIPQHPWQGSGSPCLSQPDPCLAFCAAVKVQLSPASDSTPRAHRLPHCGTHPESFCGSTMGLWSRNRSASMSAGMKVIWGKERQSPGPVLGTMGTHSPHSGKRARVSLQRGLGSFPTMFGCLPWKWLF